MADLTLAAGVTIYKSRVHRATRINQNRKCLRIYQLYAFRATMNPRSVRISFIYFCDKENRKFLTPKMSEIL